MPLSFGDNVRVRATPATENVGVAGRAGNIHGVTTPSVTGVEVVGGLAGDQAFNVFFDELNKGFWFAPELLEFVDHGPAGRSRLRACRRNGSALPMGSGKNLRASRAHVSGWPG